MTFIASPDDPVAERGRVSAAELSSMPFVARNKASATRAMIESSPHKIGMGFDRLNIVLVPGGAEAVKAAVEAGAGIGAVLRLSLRRELRACTLSTIE
jgi:DNA-binding transcriptional LysR family regulator